MTHRPTPTIATRDESDRLRRHLDETRERFERESGVLGLVLHGGLSRGYADARSEIDLLVVVDEATRRTWGEGRAPIPIGITRLEGQLYDIDLRSLSELSESWTSSERWDRSYADVLYDPTGKVQEVFDEQLTADQRPGPDEVQRHLFESWWQFRLSGDCWLHRGDPVQGTYVMNTAVSSLLQAVFTVNEEFVPHNKWIVHMSRSLEWTPRDWVARLSEALASDPTSVESVRTRQQTIESLWTDVDEYARGQFEPDLPVSFMQRSYYHALAYLADAGRVLLATWDERFGLAILNQDPFAQVTRLTGNHVVLDADALESVTPAEMYEWHYQVVEAVVEARP